MTINKINDYWGDYKNYSLGNFNGSLHYYFLDTQLLKTYAIRNALAVPPVSAIVNVNYAPYLTRDMLNLNYVELDVERFPYYDQTYGEGVAIPTTNLLRIQDKIDSIDTVLGNIQVYKPQRINDGMYHWQNEGKLWQYPYSYLQLVDGIGLNAEYVPHLFNNPTSTKEIRVNTPINNLGIYNIYIDGYKNADRMCNSQLNETPKNMAITSSTYADYMASSQAQLAVKKKQNLVDTGIGIASGILNTASGAVSSYITGGAIGTTDLANGAIGIVQTASNGYFNAKSLIAQQRDMMNVSNGLVDYGGDVMFNRSNSNGALTLYRLRMDNNYMEILGSFFHMYGYAQNKLMPVNYRNRYYFNYIKTGEANIVGQGIPKSHLEELKSLFNNGLTIWHVDRAGVTVGDYSRDNREV